MEIYQWWYGIGKEPEIFFPAESRENAEAEGHREILEGNHEGETFFTIKEARRGALDDDIFVADHVLERFADCNEEMADNDGEIGMENVTEGQKAELADALNDAFSAWRERHKLGRAFQLDEDRNVEVIEVKGISEDSTPV